jgi:D-xylose transport system substrate-binding protein
MPFLVLAGLVLMACGGTTPSTTAGKKIALLLPEATTARYDTKDKPYFEAKLKSLCADCTLLYSNAKQDAPTQQTQAEAAITNGASVIVLDPVDGAAAAAIVTKAKAANIPVISYDRLILNTADLNYYLSFDNAKVGALQGNALLAALTAAGKTNPQIVQINGDPADNNAKLFKQGAHSVLDGHVKYGKEYDTPGWKPSNAQTEMQGALTALSNKVDGVLAANDGTAGGAIAAMKAAGLKPLPPITGQDAELAAIQRIIVGEQTMTVYKAIKAEAEAAAVLAYDLAFGVAVPADMTGGATVNNGKADIKSVLLVPVAVTKANVQATVVKDGFWTAADICTSAYASACATAGIS